MTTMTAALVAVLAQSPATAPAPAAPLTPAQQIAAAIQAAPEERRADATVMGYDESGKLVTLRQGKNDLICLADNPTSADFEVDCYQKDLEPFMARGRELHARKLSREAIDSVRLADIKSGRYAMPEKPAALYQYFAPRDSVNATTGVVNGATYLYVVYLAYATPATTGITANPVDGGPWIMYPGKPWAHIMIQPQKTATITPQ
jgi:hypothetical protein